MLHHRKEPLTVNAHILSRFPIPATDGDRPAPSRISTPDDVGVYMIRASGNTPIVPTTHGVSLGWLVPPGQGDTFQGTSLAPGDFQDFINPGSIDDLDVVCEQSQLV